MEALQKMLLLILGQILLTWVRVKQMGKPAFVRYYVIWGTFRG